MIFFPEKIPYSLKKADGYSFPKMYLAEQKFNDTHIDNIDDAVHREISALSLPNITGKTVAITAGSRGIPNMPEAIRAIGQKLKVLGAKPFVVPAMGSHGGATAEGQLEVLRSFGITEDYLGMPIVSSMRTVYLGASEQGVNVYCDANAYGADFIVVTNRVKPHTDFRSDIESGLCKMMVVGLGKYDGANALHKTGSGDMGTRLKGAAKVFLDSTKILFGLALVDNPFHKTALVKAVRPEKIFEEEPKLLALAAKSMPRLLIHDIDVLIIDEFGKEISGCGMDPNITGRFTYNLAFKSPDYPDVDKIVLMRTTEMSHGNASGLGVADYITNKFVATIDLASIYTNCLNSRYSLAGKVPFTMNSDLDAIYAAASSCARPEIKDTRIVRIKNTLELNKIMISENYLDEVRDNPDIKIVSGPFDFQFDADDNLADLP